MRRPGAVLPNPIMPRYNHRKTKAYQERMKQEQWCSHPRAKRSIASHGSKQIRFPIEELGKHKGLVARTCPTCKKDFAVYKCVIAKTHQTWCSKECYVKGRNPAKLYASKMSKAYGKSALSNAKRILKQKGFFKEHKNEYRDKIINCPESPTGKAYVGINKSPFMPAAENGHGFQGVLLQDENREFVQCHGCGVWMQKITNRHLQSCSNLSIKDYKAKYGLGADTGLVSDETSLRLTKAALKNKVAQKAFAKQHSGRNGVNGRKTGHSMEFFNKFGTCPLQLKTRLIEFIKCNRELPSQGNRGRTIYKALRKRYGSFGHALSAHGLPWMKRHGTNMRFAFSDGTIYKYNINQFHDREALYAMIMEKCPVMKEAPTPSPS